MNKTTASFLAIYIVMSVSKAFGQTSTAPSGAGTAANPYAIATINNLYWLSKTSAQWSAGKYFIQTADIDATASAAWESSRGFSPIGSDAAPFNANYNGNGYKIKNLALNRATTYNLGMFGYAGASSVIRNLTLETPSIRTSSAVESTYMGGLIGNNFGTITSCKIVNGVVSGGKQYVGGIAGICNGTMTDCSFSGTVNGTVQVGGLIGYARAITIRNCFTSGTINATSNVGGLLGNLAVEGKIYNSYSLARVTITGSYGGGALGQAASGTVIQNCYATGAVTGGSSRGGFIGFSSATITNCFWDKESSGMTTSAGAAVGKTTAEMKNAFTFINATWDFKCETANGTSDVWMIQAVSNTGYPLLSWQGSGYSDNCPIWLGKVDEDMANAANWSLSRIPTNNSDIIIASDAVYNMKLSQNFTAAAITFNNAGKKIVLGDYNLQYNSASGFNGANYFITDGAGILRKSLATAAVNTFPVGNGSYTPITLTNHNSATDLFGVRISNGVFKDGTSGVSLPGGLVRNTFNIYKNNPNTGDGVSMVFNWNLDDITGLFTQPVLYHLGSRWEKQTGIAFYTYTSLNYRNYTGSFSPFAILDATTVLPVTWGSIDVKKQQDHALLKWTTLTEEKTDVYIVQHSINGRDWVNLSTVEAAGNSSTLMRYEFLHNRPSAGMNYYRLLQQDIDGRYEYSKVVLLKWEAYGAGLIAFPNPVENGKVQVNVMEAGTLQIFNNTGALVKQVTVRAGINAVDVSMLSKGLYRLKAGEESASLLIK